MLLQTLRLLEGFDIAAMDPLGPDFVHIVVEALIPTVGVLIITESRFIGPYRALAAPAAQSGMPIPGYRYVYEPDRILVIDPYTNIAVQAIPR